MGDISIFGRESLIIAVLFTELLSERREYVIYGPVLSIQARALLPPQRTFLGFLDQAEVLIGEFGGYAAALGTDYESLFY